MGAPPIFVLSHARSGSTLLRYLLDTHPEICSPGEIGLGAICEALVTGFDLTLGEAANSHDVPPTARETQFERVRQIVTNWLDDYCLSKAKRRWCDKSPSNMAYIPWLQSVFPDASWICLHRHGLDCVKSMIETGYRPELFVERNHGDIVPATIELWCVGTERLLAVERSFQSRTLRVTYEDIVENTEAELGRIWSFLHVTPISGIGELAFKCRHDEGPGDYRTAGRSEIRRSRIGQGLTLDLTNTSPVLRVRMHRLMETLGYCTPSASSRGFSYRVSEPSDGVAETRGV